MTAPDAEDGAARLGAQIVSNDEAQSAYPAYPAN